MIFLFQIHISEFFASALRNQVVYSVVFSWHGYQCPLETVCCTDIAYIYIPVTNIVLDSLALHK